jgi:hypothetical protein
VRDVIAPGLKFGGLLFALGFVLGTIRFVILTRWPVDPLAAVLVELPVMLLAGWWWAGQIVRRHGNGSAHMLLAIGVVGVLTIWVGELGVATILSGDSVIGWLRGLSAPPALVGLLGQCAVALMPLLRGKRG